MSRSMSHDDEDIDIGFEHVPPERLCAHSRRQLSAMLDGELPPDQARFMLRRLQHDAGLTECWERWQLCGDVLRGQGHALLPTDFSARVAAALGAGPVPAPVALPARRPRHGLLRWGGGALAASVAVGALFMARQLPDPQLPEQVAATSAIRMPASAASAPAAPENVADAAAPLVVATAEAARRAADRGTTRSQAQRAAVRRTREVSQPVAQLETAVAGISPASAAVAVDAFAVDVTPAFPLASLSAAAPLPPAPLPPPDSEALFGGPVAATRPWPRAVLPGIPRAQPHAAGYGLQQSDPFAPFQPRIDAGVRVPDPRRGRFLPLPDRQEPAHDSTDAPGSAR